MSKVYNRNLGCFMIIFIFVSLISTIYTAYKSIPEFCLIFKPANYYLHPERYKKINVDIDEFNQSQVSFDFDYGISNNLENGKIPISIINLEKLNVDIIDYSSGLYFVEYQYFDEFHIKPSFNIQTENPDSVIDLYAYNRNFEIYFNQQDWIAFYNPYLKANFIDNTIYVLGKCHYIILFIISFLCFVFSERFASEYALVDPATKKNYTNVSKSVMANIVIIGLSGALTLVAIFFTIRFMWQANQDWYTDYEKFNKIEIKIDDFKVEEDIYYLKSGKSGSQQTIHWTNFLGYQGYCTSNELNNQKTKIAIYQNREIANEVQDSTHQYKHIVWYNPENKMAYLPSTNEKLQSRFMVFVDMVIDHWFLYIGLGILLIYFIYWKFIPNKSNYEIDESLNEQYTITKNRPIDNF